MIFVRTLDPAIVKRTVTPKRLANAKLRTPEYLTEAEVDRLMAAAKGTRYRSAELCGTAK